MISHTTLAAFLTASILLAITPGPGILYVLTRSLAGGRREGILSSFGTLVGGCAHVLAAGLGVSAIVATSASVYHAIRWAGAAYLVYLGIRMFRSGSEENDEITLGGVSKGNTFAQGVITEVLNPKTALFFLSFIPQFVDPKAGAVFGQFLLFGTITVVLNTTADLAVAIFAGPIGQKLLRSSRGRKNQKRVTGALMVSLGVYVAAREA
jgi:threonine/homoserine/homoserine lactone efflux protein